MNNEKNSINKERVFSFVQRLSQSIMLPITLMPIAGFLLAHLKALPLVLKRLFSSFSENETTR